MDLDAILVRCIHDTLAGVMGLRVCDAIYLDLLTSFSLTTEELPGHLESLQAVFEKNFGPIATRTLSRAIARRLCSELQIDFPDKPHFSLVDYVAEARRFMDSSQSKA